MIVYFVIVATFRSLVAKKVDFTESVGLQVAQAECLIPALGEDVDGNLPSNRVL